MTFDERVATDNWAEIDYDRAVWIPVPLGFEGTKWGDAAEWAFEYACQRYLQGGRVLTKKAVKKEVLPLAEKLVLGQAEAAGHVPAHKLYFHCRDLTRMPVLAAVGLWKSQGSREEAFQYYAYWGSKSATSTPVGEWFTAESLGTGLRAHWTGAFNQVPYEQAGYAFRDDTYATDVHVFLMAPDHTRFTEVLPDLDRLVRGIRCIPDPGT